MIQNPILPGFHPDPSIVRAGEDFYLVTSSFGWFPGLPLYHSRDLAHWRLAGHLLKTKRQADLTGLAQCRGVWAPGLSHDAASERFYLTYSVVRNRNDWLFDVDNYLMWTDDPLGQWSEPVYVNSSGFDPFLFVDDDGSAWMLNKDRDFRPDHINSRPIVIQRFDLDAGQLVGQPTVISRGATKRRFVEGAHLCKRDGWYYLLTAEGGTGYGHCTAVARARHILGPYQPSPYGPLLTSATEAFEGDESRPFLQPERYRPDAPLSKAGHGSLVDTPQGEWYLAHLCARPLMPGLRCTLGRETALQKIVWTQDGWPQLDGGSPLPRLQVPSPAGVAPFPFPAADPVLRFGYEPLDAELCALRNEITPDWTRVDEARGLLMLRGRESLTSCYQVSLLARRLTAFRARAEVKMYFSPERYHHMAGLCCYYDEKNHFCAYKTRDERLGAAVGVYGFTANRMEYMACCAPVPQEGPVWLRAEIDGPALRFFYSTDGEAFAPLGPELDMSALSDEAIPGGFTGSFVGMFAQDLYTRRQWAGYEFFRYEPLS